MDEFWGFLVAIGLAIAALFWIVKAIFWLLAQLLLGVGWVFLALSSMFGHPAVLLLMICVLGAGIGMIVHRRKHGKSTARSAEDYAEIGSLRMVPEHWAALVLGGFALVVGLFGMLLV